MSTGVLVIGSLNMDLVVVASRHPQIGETILGKTFATFPGGKGANQAIAAARLGASVQLIGCIGQDPFGQVLQENLVKNEVDCSLLKISAKSNTGTALITVGQSGGNSIIVVPGANYDLLPEDIDRLEEVISRSGLVVLQMEIPLNTVWKSVLLARKHSVPTLLNPAPAHPIPDVILNGLDYLIPNESELNLLTGLPTGTQPEILKASKSLLSKGVKRVIFTRGKQGCFFIDQEKDLWLPAYNVRAVDTTAAGDAFIGGFISSLTRGEDTQAALKIGSAAGALAVTSIGAQTSLPTRKELEDFLKTQKKEVPTHPKTVDRNLNIHN